MSAHSEEGKHKAGVGIALIALGVVFGDIGTSPLYAVKEIFHPVTGVPLTQDNLVGALSLMIWSLFIVVALKYVVLVLRADNRGEGGVMALLALASSSVRDKPKLRRILLILGVFGASLFYGDGVITPAISVLGAMEGLEVATPVFKPYVLPATVFVLSCLFLAQRGGTAKMGAAFAPIMLTWFLTLAFFGARHIIEAPQVLAALNPFKGLGYFLTHGWVGFTSLGAIVLALTGAEALYADMGHFGRRPLRIDWFLVVMPSLALNYLGQGALLLNDANALANPFFNLFPRWLLYPGVVLATAAAVIASQATISGTYSMTKQAIQLGFLPRLTILFTSEKEAGQVYIPFVNWLLLGIILFVVITFGSSSNLASAYGVAVTGTMLVTSILTFFVIRYGWGMNWFLCVFATGFFVLIDLAFFSANLLKLGGGGWLPLVIGLVIFTVMVTWFRGREIVVEKHRAIELDLGTFLQSLMLDPPNRVPGTAVFLVGDAGYVPGTLLHNLLHNKVLHERVMFLSVSTLEIPYVSADKRMTVKPLGSDFFQVEIRYGFKDAFDVPAALNAYRFDGFELNPMETSYFIGRERIVSTPGDGMAMWRERLFAAMARNASNAADYFRLPANRVIELGTQLEI